MTNTTATVADPADQLTGQAIPRQGVDIDAAHRLMVSLVERVCSVVRGRDHVVRLVACALVGGGHVLLEDVPGSGKTTLGRAFAAAANVEFGRVQATADMLPADITGSGVWQPADGRFEFMPGPIFANLVLVDELNRASSRTQSAFMEALEEHAVTVDGQRHPLPDPFFVIATQNPVDLSGTFPLPDSQLDRFLLRFSLGYPDADSERALLTGSDRRAQIAVTQAQLDTGNVLALRAAVERVHASEALVGYVLALLERSRRDARVEVGLSPRAGLALLRAARARALLEGRTHVLPDDVQALFVPVAGHRLVPAAEGGSGGALAESILAGVAVD